MPEKKHQNPFEDHINSETFDMSRLSDVPIENHMLTEMQALLNSLPQGASHDLWEDELDDRQKLLCEYLTDELVDNVMRVNYGEELQDLSDSQLAEMLTVPVALAMLAEEQFHLQRQMQAIAKPENNTPTHDHPNAYEQQALDFSALGAVIRMGFFHIKNFFQRLTRKRS